MNPGANEVKPPSRTKPHTKKTLPGKASDGQGQRESETEVQIKEGQFIAHLFF